MHSEAVFARYENEDISMEYRKSTHIHILMIVQIITPITKNYITMSGLCALGLNDDGKSDRSGNDQEIIGPEFSDFSIDQDPRADKHQSQKMEREGRAKHEFHSRFGVGTVEMAALFEIE